MTGLAWNGPLARTVSDAAAMLDAIAVPMPGDPHWAPPLPPGQSFLGQVGLDPGRRRIGRYATPFLAELDVHPDCLRAWDAASALLDELGHQVEDVQPPFAADAGRLFETVWAVAANGAPVDPAAEGELRPLTRWLRGRGAAVSGPEYLLAAGTLQMLARQSIEATAGYDAVLTPTLAMPPRPVGWFTEGGDPAEDFARSTMSPVSRRSACRCTGRPRDSRSA